MTKHKLQLFLAWLMLMVGVGGFITALVWLFIMLAYAIMGG